MSQLKDWMIGLLAGLALSVNVGCSAGDDYDSEDYDVAEQALIVGANTGSSNVTFSGGKAVTGGIDRCNSATSGAIACTTGSNRVVLPKSRNIRIGVNPTFGTAAQRSTLHAILSVSCATFQSAAASPTLVTCGMLPLSDGCTQGGQPSLICARVSDSGAASGTGTARSFSDVACSTVGSTASGTFHSATRDLAACTQYRANVALGKIEAQGTALGMSATKKASATQYVTNYVIAEIMSGSSGSVASSANPLMVFSTSTPNAAPVFSMTSGEKCRIVNSDGTNSPGFYSVAQNCSGS